MGAAAARPATDRPRAGGRLPYHPALDGVRALAVVAVLAFHGGIAATPGGFLGVDAFFVLSGFLITSLLLAEHAGAGRIDLVAFWNRRLRRLLPALLLVLLTVLLVSRWLMTPPELVALRWDALAAAAYVANWRMADRGGDYFAATSVPSPLQHTWSLGIEEQFYLLWPLLLGGALWLVARRWGPGDAARHGRTLLLAACVAGAAASALAAAMLFRPDQVDRAYYGTDSRAQALLVGCALAVALAGRPARPGPHRVLGALAAAGAAVTVAAWLTAHGGDPWLFRGGLLAVALAVAAVLAHAVVSPASPTALILSLPPLVWLGRISYGVYLWHWPLFGWLTGERTGLTGPSLFGLRCAVTVAVAVASYRLLEEPIRTAGWPRGRLVMASGLVASTVAATSAVAIVAAVPPAIAPAPPIALLRALTAPPPEYDLPAAVSPVLRSGRRPGPPRITFLGDSVSWSLGTYLPAQRQLRVSVRSVQGCGIARLPEIHYIGLPHPNYPGCDRWDARWRRGVRADDPDVAVILLDRWELMDRKLDGRYRHVGDPVFDAYLNRELDLAIDIAGERGAHVALLTAPYTRRAERPDGGLWPEDQPERVDAWNALLRAAGARHGATVLDLNQLVSPGAFAWQVGGVRVRSDGLHFTPEGVQRRVAPWLLPRLARLAVYGTLAPPRIGPEAPPRPTDDDGPSGASGRTGHGTVEPRGTGEPRDTVERRDATSAPGPVMAGAAAPAGG